jgi:hypothetical protein
MRRIPSIEKRIEAVAARIEPRLRWGRVIIDDPDPEARIAEHQRATDGALCVYRVIMTPDPARHVAGAAILSPSPKPKSTGQGSGIFDYSPRERRPLVVVKPDFGARPDRFEDGK